MDDAIVIFQFIKKHVAEALAVSGNSLFDSNIESIISIETHSIGVSLNDFLGKNNKKSYISLGQNCSSAWYLRELSLRTSPSPFDWVFSSPCIVLHCLKEDFSSFLDKGNIKSKWLYAQHIKYHKYFFFHKNPIRNTKDYYYYSGCINYFLTKIKHSRDLVFMITLINEREKRILWSQGFEEKYNPPIRQDIHHMQDFVCEVLKFNPSAKFIIIEPYTNSNFSLTAKTVDKHIYWIKFCSIGPSNGAFYINKLDDFCLRNILSHIIY